MCYGDPLRRKEKLQTGNARSDLSPIILAREEKPRIHTWYPLSRHGCQIPIYVVGWNVWQMIVLFVTLPCVWLPAACVVSTLVFPSRDLKVDSSLVFLKRMVLGWLSDLSVWSFLSGFLRLSFSMSGVNWSNTLTFRSFVWIAVVSFSLFFLSFFLSCFFFYNFFTRIKSVCNVQPC